MVSSNREKLFCGSLSIFHELSPVLLRLTENDGETSVPQHNFISFVLSLRKLLVLYSSFFLGNEKRKMDIEIEQNISERPGTLARKSQQRFVHTFVHLLRLQFNSCLLNVLLSTWKFSKSFAQHHGNHHLHASLLQVDHP